MKSTRENSLSEGPKVGSSMILTRNKNKVNVTRIQSASKNNEAGDKGRSILYF